VGSARGVDGRTEFVVGIANMLQFLRERTMHSVLTVTPPSPLFDLALDSDRNQS